MTRMRFPGDLKGVSGESFQTPRARLTAGALGFSGIGWTVSPGPSLPLLVGGMGEEAWGGTPARESQPETRLGLSDIFGVEAGPCSSQAACFVCDALPRSPQATRTRPARRPPSDAPHSRRRCPWCQPCFATVPPSLTP
jgi:hypothetical protein